MRGAQNGKKSKARVLVVEDDAHLRSSIKDILELEHYTVLTAQDGRNGLEVLRDNADMPPDLIVSDIMMPYMDGIEFLKEVRKETRWVSIPFIFLTAKSEKSDIQRGKLLGVDDYLPKPFDADDLLVAVASRLDRYRELAKIQDDLRDGVMSNHNKSMLTMINHEFRTPLTLVVAYAEMLKEFDGNNMSENDVMSFLQGVNDGASRLRRLVENFIILYELENGDVNRSYGWRRRPIEDLEQILWLAHHQIFFENSPHQCQVQVEENLPTFSADSEFIVIAVRELLHNAVKFCPPEKQIILGAYAENGEIVIWVEDQGRGIPENEFENIWRMFYQVNRDYYETQGSGSGLAIVRGIVQSHGGRTKVESKEGEGTRISLMFPIAPA